MNTHIYMYTCSRHKRWPSPPLVHWATCWQWFGSEEKFAAGQPPPERSTNIYHFNNLLNVYVVSSGLFKRETEQSTGLCGCIWLVLITFNLSLACLFMSNVEKRLDSRPRMWTIWSLLVELGWIRKRQWKPLERLEVLHLNLHKVTVWSCCQKFFVKEPLLHW